MARKNLRKVAEKIFSRCLYDGWEPRTIEMQTAYGLSEQQIAKVKQYVKAYAADVGLVGWAYDDLFDRFRVCPENDVAAAKRMAKYALKSTAAQGKGAGHLLRGLKRQKYVTEASYMAGAAMLEGARKQIGTIPDVLQFQSDDEYVEAA